MAQKKPTPQMIFFKELLEKYRLTDNSTIHPRGFHYYIVTRPEAERQIPSQSGNRLYENTWNEYKNLCSVVANARVLGLIPFDWISDNRNDDIDEKLLTESVSNTFELTLPDLGETPLLESKHMEDFDDFVHGTTILNNTKPCHFIHQTYHICVVIEKSSYSTDIQKITAKHGADFIVFSGQASVTRVNEVCLRAKTAQKPLLALYCSDLDVAGFGMPRNFMRRVNQIYPCDGKNRLERVLLIRAQTLQHNLPPSFEVKSKKYPKKQVDEFVAETGSDICVELDALPKRVLLEIIDNKLSEFSHLDEDQKEFDKKNRQFSELSEAMRENLDISDMKDEYDQVKEEFNIIIDRVQEFQSEIASELSQVESSSRHLKEHVESVIEEFIEQFEKDHPFDDDEDGDSGEVAPIIINSPDNPADSTNAECKPLPTSILDLELDENELEEIDGEEEETESD